MTRDFVEKWLDTMRSAWINADMKTIKSLFSKTAEYYETPFEKPATNIAEVLELWEGVENQIIKRLEFIILAVDGNSAVVQWIFECDGASFDGIYLIKFNDDQECIFFKSWEMERPLTFRKDMK